MNTAAIPLTKEITVEELVTTRPESIRILLDRGIAALVCGEPAWGTLEELAKDKGLTDGEIELLVADLSAIPPPG